MLVSCQNNELLNHVLQIVQSIYKFKLDCSPIKISEEEYLSAIAFTGLPNCEQFLSSKKQALTSVLCNIFDELSS